MIGFLVFKAINDLKITVEVGLVVGTIPQTTPTEMCIRDRLGAINICNSTEYIGNRYTA